MHSAAASYRQRPHAVFMACALGLVCFACQGGQTGGEVVEGPPSVPGSSLGCDREILGMLAIDAREPLGFSGADALAAVLDRRAAELAWSADTLPFSIGPEQGLSSIDLALEYRGGPVRWLHFKRSGASTDQPSTGDTGCGPDRLAIEVVVRLRTGGGAFDEEFSAELEAPSATYPSLVHELSLDTLSGSFTVSAPAGYSAPVVVVSAAWGEQYFLGTLAGLVERETAQSNASRPESMSVIYATWPPPSAEE